MTDDPYAAPKSATDPTHAKLRRPSAWWWLYVGLLGLMFVGGMSLSWRNSGISLATVLPFTVNLWALLGLIGFVRMRAIGPRWPWLICLAITVLQLGVGSVLFLSVLLSSGWTFEHWVALSGLIGPALMLPLVYALSRYVFGFRDLWRKR